MTSFHDIGLHPDILDALDDIGYETPTAIQADAVPPMLEGHDMVGQAPTGTGKTAAFGLALAQHTEPGKGVQALVLTPTRELCRQVAREVERLTQHRGQSVLMIYGGVSYGPQISGLKQGNEIVVGTPGRVRDLIERGSFKTSELRVVVLDEADRMLDMGFIEDVGWIIDQTPRNRQSLLFSATIPPEIENLAGSFCHRPTEISTGGIEEIEHREEYVIEVGPRNKAWALERIIESEEPELAFVFCGTRHRTQKIANLLKRHNIDAEAIHGGLTQGAREAIMRKVRDGKVHVLVGTDVLARGIDVRTCDLVVNYDPPRDPEDYVHRVGRTARMEDLGKAYTLITRDDSRALVEIEGYAGAELTRIPVPETKGKDGIRKIHDWEEQADHFGMVHFTLSGLPKDAGRMDMYWDLVKGSEIHKDDVGRVELEGDTLTLQVRHDAASRFEKHVRKNGLLGNDVDIDVLAPS